MSDGRDFGMANSGTDAGAGAATDAPVVSGAGMTESTFNATFNDALASNQSNTPNQNGFGTFGLTENGKPYVDPKTGKCAT